MRLDTEVASSSSETRTPSKYQTIELPDSESWSGSLYWYVALNVSVSTGLDGDNCAFCAIGGALRTVTGPALSIVPKSSPSEGFTSTDQTSSLTTDIDIWSSSPISNAPLLYQRIVVPDSVSPSASLKVYVKVNPVSTVGLVGESSRLEATGGVFVAPAASAKVMVLVPHESPEVPPFPFPNKTASEN